MDIPSEQEINNAVQEILRNNDLQTITLRMVMNMLCDRFSLSRDQLSNQKVYVRSIINDFLENNYEPPAEEQQQVSRPGAKRPAPASAPAPDPSEGPDDDDQEQLADDPDPDVPNDANDRLSPPARPAPAKSPSAPKTVKLTGLERPVVLAQPLADFIGEVVIPRSHIPKRVSAYAKERGLQDPEDGRRIICDPALKEALGVDSFTFFSLAKLISGLVYKPEECDPELQQIAKECEEKLVAEKTRKLAQAAASPSSAATATRGRGGKGSRGGKAGRPSKKQKTGEDGEPKARKPSGLQRPMQLSDALVAIVGEPRLPRSEVLKKIWVYIRENNLKDPNNGSRVLCDDKLMAVFDGSQTVSNMGITKYLSAHMTKIEEA